METPPKKIIVNIKDESFVEVYYFLTDDGMGKGLEFLNMIVRGNFGRASQLAQIFSKKDVGNEEKEIEFVNTLVRDYYETKA